MAYKLVIADDEERIALGLRDLIPWEQIGFQVEKILMDGQEVIDYIADNEVHVVLTDIKMSSVSGIDVARYVHEHHLPVRVVLISAYNDFAYARQAIAFGVSSYILKPTKLPEIREVFTRLRAEIDEEEEHSRRALQLREDSEKIESLLVRQFFSDIYYGALRSREDVERRMRFLHLKVDPNKSLCCLFSIVVREESPLQSQMGDIYHYINTTRIVHINSSSRYLNFYPLHHGSQRITYLSIELEGNADKDLQSQQSSIRFHFDELLSQIAALFSIQMELQFHASFGSLFEFADSVWEGIFQPQAALAGADGLELLESRIAGLSAHLRAHEERMACNILDVIYTQLSGESLHLLRSISSAIALELLDAGAEDREVREFLKKLKRTSEPDKLRRMTHELIHSGTGHKKERPEDLTGAVQAYVQEHFKEDIFLDSAAEAIGVSPAHLSRLFKKSAGIGFTQYLMNTRLEKASELLAGSPLHIYEISQQVGYSNIYYFFRIFKNRFGCTPSEYRAARQRTPL